MKNRLILGLFLCFGCLFGQEQKLQEGIDLYNKGEFKAAIELLTGIEAEAKERKNPKVLQGIYTNLGNAYSAQGTMELALSYYQKGLDIAYHEADTLKMGQITNNIATIYSDIKDFDRALEYYEKASLWAQIVGDEGTLADCANGRAMIYEQQGKFQEALDLYAQALDIYVKYEAKDRIALAYNNLGIVHKQLNQLDKTVYYYQKALEIAEEIQAGYIVAALSANLANVYMLQKQYGKAIATNHLAQQKAKQIGAFAIVVETYGNLKDVYAEMKDYKKAFEYATLYQQAHDSLINTERTAQLLEMKEKYESEKKEAENVALRNQNRLKELELTEKSLQLQKRNLMLLGSLLVLVLSGIVVRLYISRQKAKSRELQVLAVKETEKQERIRIAKDLHDDLGSGLTKLNLIGNLIAKEASQDEKLSGYGKTIKTTVKQLSDSIKILIWSLNSESLNRGEFVSYIRAYTYDYFDDFPITLEFDSTVTHIEKPLSKDMFRQLFMTFKECLNNVAKHAQASRLTILLSDTPEQMQINITDNGKGIENKEHKGNGLKNIRHRIESVGGIIDIQSQPGEGTKIHIVIR
jgi:signal transduction histidine kinase